jgi:transposase
MKSKLSCVGVDVSAETLDVHVRTASGETHSAQFGNDPAGHKQLIRSITKKGRSAHVVLEATGVYSLDLALALHEARGVEVMVVNPRSARRFAEACLQRSSTDRTMALTLCEFAARMEFVPWTPPAPEIRELRGIGRRIATLTAERTSELNRLHAARSSADTAAVVVNDIEVNARHLERRIEELERHALSLIAHHPALQRAFQRVTSIKGIAARSALQLLGELLVLPSDMLARQWVAHSGLDVRHFDSGSSVHKQPRISKHGNAHIRRILYMPALVAIQREPHVRAFYEQLIAAGKKKLQAVVAVMRKLLHAVYGMLKTNTDFDGARFRQLPAAA